MPTTARSRFSATLMLAATSLSLVACAGDTTAPTAVSTTSELATSPLAPIGAQKALVGAVDGTYTFTVDPEASSTLRFGESRLVIPEDAICRIGTSTYGAQYWNDGCERERGMVTITAVVRNAATDRPSVEFQPAMRFHPDKSVMLYLHVTDQATLNNAKVLKYCNATGCIDESLQDSSLASYVNTEDKVVFRRIKHFSGYVVTNLVEDAGALLGTF